MYSLNNYVLGIQFVSSTMLNTVHRIKVLLLNSKERSNQEPQLSYHARIKIQGLGS